MKRSPSLGLKILAIAIPLCTCLLLTGLGVYYLLSRVQQALPAPVNAAPQGSPTTTPFTTTQLPAGSGPTDTYSLLEQTNVPVNDYDDLACRLVGKCGLAFGATLQPPAAPRQVGEQARFWVTDQDTLQSIQITATLRYVTPHVYFWVDNLASYNDNDVHKLGDTFENKIYPTDREYFGSEWTPGIDGDVHIYIVYAHGLGTSVGGYFSSDDEFSPLVRPYSNSHEMFLINSTENLTSDYTFGTLAHEFQHMIDWNLHRNQSTWMSEGSAELAAFLNGYSIGSFDHLFIANPDLQLDNWPNDPSDPTADEVNYGAGFLFMDYFFNRFGKQALQTLIKEPGSGLEDVVQTLHDIHAIDPRTGGQISVDDLFLDWAITNFIQDPSVGDGRYTYANYPNAPQAAPTETISTCPLTPAARTVHQYGTDYIRITCPGNTILHFQGARTTPLLPVDPHSGSYAFWSNKGDSSDMTLTHAFDFTGITAPITMTYWTWYDIENNWDYVYLEASTDGQHWQILITPSGTADNPTGSSFGWGYTGTSNRWKQETIDLSQFAGQKMSLRFEYVTDLAVNGEGFLLDDVSIPAIHYATDFEADSGGWSAQGFARVENLLPQTFRLALIEKNEEGTTVQIVPVSPDQTADIPLSIGSGGMKEAVLVITGTTQFTRSLAAYQIGIR